MMLRRSCEYEQLAKELDSVKRELLSLVLAVKHRPDDVDHVKQRARDLLQRLRELYRTVHSIKEKLSCLIPRLL